MLSSRQPNSLAVPRESFKSGYWADLLVTIWVLFVGLGICGLITLAGFPLGWSEPEADTAEAAQGATRTMEASAASQPAPEGEPRALRP